MTEHEHTVDETADEPDRCTICGDLVCPDCWGVVDYDPDHDHYWHRDGSVCWLHGGEPWAPPSRGRPPVGRKFTVRLPVYARAELDRRAAAEGVPPAEVARRLLVGALSDARTTRDGAAERPADDAACHHLATGTTEHEG